MKTQILFIDSLKSFRNGVLQWITFGKPEKVLVFFASESFHEFESDIPTWEPECVDNIGKMRQTCMEILAKFGAQAVSYAGDFSKESIASFCEYQSKEGSIFFCLEGMKADMALRLEDAIGESAIVNSIPLNADISLYDLRSLCMIPNIMNKFPINRYEKENGDLCGDFISENLDMALGKQGWKLYKIGSSFVVLFSNGNTILFEQQYGVVKHDFLLESMLRQISCHTETCFLFFCDNFGVCAKIQENEGRKYPKELGFHAVAANENMLKFGQEHPGFSWLVRKVAER